jgi:flagellar motor switch protein FliG
VKAMLSPALRKAAVLISALDEPAAEAMLQQLGADDAAKIRRALVELPDIPALEQQEVLTDFLKRQGPAAPAAAQVEDVSLELDPVVEAAAGEAPLSAKRSALQSNDDRHGFAFLERVEPDTLAAVLSRELPQTIAVVVAQLAPEQAAAVLQRLPAAIATSALERIAWLDDLLPEIKAELAVELRRQLAPHMKAAMADSASLGRLAAVLEAMDHRQRQRVVRQLGERNASLLRRLGLTDSSKPPLLASDGARPISYRLESVTSPRAAIVSESAGSTARRQRPTFDDLQHIDDDALRAVLAAVDPEIALLALTGAQPRLVTRILRQLSPHEASVLQNRLEHPGPVRLRDIERAREALVAAANQLIHRSSDASKPVARFAAAV